jgi:uncharacterized protein
MHIYHYAPYEPTHLLAMAARYGVREAEVDALLREGVFVDLYPIVRRALRVGSRSYSIKKLEPLYMGAEVRTSDAARRRLDRQVCRGARADGRGADAAGAAILDDLADYNRYDCVSTRRLRNWLVERAREANLLPSADIDAAERPYEPSPRADALTRMAGAAEGTMPPTWPRHRAQARRRGDRLLPARGEDLLGDALPAAARARLDLGGHRDVVVFDHDRCRVLSDWHVPEGGRVQRRVIELRGDLAPGTKLSAGCVVPAVRAADAVPGRHEPAMDPLHVRSASSTSSMTAWSSRRTPFRGFTWQELPIASTPPAPPQAGSQQAAIDQWADAIIQAAPASAAFPSDAATDLLLRRVPRTRSGALARGEGLDDVDDIVRSVDDLDRSYLAVQGPPGPARPMSARTWLHGSSARRDTASVSSRSRTPSSRTCSSASSMPGVPGERRSRRRRRHGIRRRRFTAIAKDGYAAFAAAHPEGFVIGGTAWDLSHPGRVPRGSLDLLVIDEAGSSRSPPRSRCRSRNSRR